MNLFFIIPHFSSIFSHYLVFDLIGHFIYYAEYRNNKNYDYSSVNDFLERSIFDKIYMRIIIIYGLMIIVYIPLSLKKSLGSIQYLGIVGTTTIFYLLILLIIQSNEFYDQAIINNHEKHEINWFDLGKAFDDKMLFFVKGCNIIFNYDCQFGLVAIYGSLKDKRIIKLKTLNAIGIILITIMILIVSIFGFFTSPYTLNELIIFRDGLNSDWPMTIGKLIVCISVIADVAIHYNQIRLSGFGFLFNKTEFTSKQNVIFSIINYIVLCSIAIFYKKIIFYISFAGGWTSTIYCFILPTIMYIKVYKLEYKSFNSLILIVCFSLISIIGFLGGLYSLINVIRGVDI